jgi:hypothetical protein
MKFNSILKAVAVPAIAAFLFVGCTGPAGPEGPQGNNGVSDISVTTFSINTTLSAWNGSSPNFYLNLTAAQITSDATDLVMVYFVSNTGDYEPLPCSPGIVANDALSYTFNTGVLNLYYYDPSGTPSGTWVFNMIVVPPSVQKKHPNTNWNNYTEVKAIMDMQPVSIHKN